ncbi:MAG TPA: TetR/AcrR family transcriptional regulator [Treponemataceae bacterium]|nr:TetR/AcrR family transcriptional regulator [Treponemataceae bacterium]
MGNEKTNKKKELLAVALQLFSKRGYEGTSVQEIVNRAGVTKPSLYYFFKSKQGIYEALWEKYFIPFCEAIEKAASYEPCPTDYNKDVFPQLCHIAQYYYDFSKNNPVFFKLMRSLQYAPVDADGIDKVQTMYCMQFSVIKKFFDKVAKTHGNVGKKTDLLSHIFIADIYSGIRANIKAETIVNLFMHGIF